jgi:hypothetical protein
MGNFIAICILRISRSKAFVWYAPSLVLFFSVLCATFVFRCEKSECICGAFSPRRPYLLLTRGCNVNGTESSLIYFWKIEVILIIFSDRRNISCVLQVYKDGRLNPDKLIHVSDFRVMVPSIIMTFWHPGAPRDEMHKVLQN